MGILPNDVVIEIFLRLTAKVLIRFKTVCKNWYKIINDPHFSKLHVDRSISTKTNLHFLVKTPLLHLADFDTFNNPIELSYPFKSSRLNGGVAILGSCRGLVLLWGYDYAFNLIAYNPTTQTHRTLPFQRRSDCFRDLVSKAYLGLGYDTSSDNYKCVRIYQQLCMISHVFENEVTVYSFKADSWKRGPDIPYYFHNKWTPNCTVLNDKLHWIGVDSRRVLVPVLAFCLRDETFSSVPLPQFFEPPISSETLLFEQDGCLCLVAHYPSHYDGWIMREYGVVESWMTMFRITRGVRQYMEWPICYSISRERLFLGSRINAASVELESMKHKFVKVAGFDWCPYLDVCVENLLMLEGRPDVRAGKTKKKQPASAVKERPKKEKKLQGKISMV